MDIDAMTKELAALGHTVKGEQDEEPTTYPPSHVPICGKTGHWGRNCRYKDQTPQNQQPKGKGGNRNPDNTQRCWTCGVIGHRQAQCPQKKGGGKGGKGKQVSIA
eukprot:3209793-Amphidinium_carterae.1